MRFTGERVIPDRYELKPMLQEHIIRYEFALPYVKDADVIDLGCGCGYGAHYLAINGARSVIGVDIDHDSIEYARRNYHAPNLTFEKMDVERLNLPSASFQTVVCLEVFEHVTNYNALLEEATRILAPNGRLILSTPNKDIWSPGREKPINPWHIWEFTREEFGQIMETHLPKVEYWVQTTKIPGIIPFILLNLRLQGYYTRNKSKIAQMIEWLHNSAMKIAMLPPHLIPGAMAENPNFIVQEAEIPPNKHFYFVVVGHKDIVPA